MKNFFLVSLLFFSNPVFSEEYLCSIIVGDRTETKSYERKGNLFLYPTQNWWFKILHEDKNHMILGNFSEPTVVHPDTTIFLTIIDKQNLDFSERWISSDEEGDNFFSGNCSLKI